MKDLKIKLVTISMITIFLIISCNNVPQENNNPDKEINNIESIVIAVNQAIASDDDTVIKDADNYKFNEYKASDGTIISGSATVKDGVIQIIELDNIIISGESYSNFSFAKNGEDVIVKLNGKVLDDISLKDIPRKPTDAEETLLRNIFNVFNSVWGPDEPENKPGVEYEQKIDEENGSYHSIARLSNYQYGDSTITNGFFEVIGKDSTESYSIIENVIGEILYNGETYNVYGHIDYVTSLTGEYLKKIDRFKLDGQSLICDGESVLM